MKLLIDMNLSPKWCNFLADAGVESSHWSTVGSYDAPDSPEVIGGRVIVALGQMASELHEGALLTIDPNRTRITVLPLRILGKGR